MKKAFLIFSVIVVALIVTSCMQSPKPEEIMNKIEFHTGLKIPVIATSLELEGTFSDIFNDNNLVNIDMEVPKVSFSETSFNVTSNVSISGGSSGNIPFDGNPKSVSFIPVDGSGNTKVKELRADIVLGLSIMVNGNNRQGDTIEGVNIIIKDGDGNDIPFTYYPQTQTIYIASSTVLKFNNSGNITITVNSVDISTVDGINSGDTITLVVSQGTILLYVVNGLLVDFESPSYPQDLTDNGIVGVKFDEATLTIKSDEVLFDKVDGQSFTVSDGTLVASLSGKSWDENTNLGVSLNSVDMHFDSPLQIEDESKPVSIDVEFELSKFTIDFGDEGTSMILYEGELPLPEDQGLEAATITLEGTNLTGISPYIELYVNGKLQTKETLNATFSISLPISAESLPEEENTIKVVAGFKGKQTIDLNIKPKIDVVVLFETDVVIKNDENSQ